VVIDLDKIAPALIKFGPVFILSLIAIGGMYLVNRDCTEEVATVRAAGDNRMQAQRESNEARLVDQREAADKRVHLYIELTSTQNKAIMDRYDRDHSLYVKVLTDISNKTNTLLSGQAAIIAKAVLIMPGDEAQIKEYIEKHRRIKR